MALARRLRVDADRPQEGRDQFMAVVIAIDQPAFDPGVEEQGQAVPGARARQKVGFDALRETGDASQRPFSSHGRNRCHSSGSARELEILDLWILDVSDHRRRFLDEILELKTRSGDVEFKWHATLEMPMDWNVTMKFDSLIATAVFLAGLVVGSSASAQSGFNAAGGWSCSVVLTERGLRPYGYQAEIYAQPDGSLFANGAVYDPNLMQSVVPFQARGDWAVFPSANGPHVRLRAHTSTHGILVFEGYAKSNTRIYVVAQLNSGGQAESQCTRTR